MLCQWVCCYRLNRIINKCVVDNYRNCSYYSILVIITLVIKSCNEFLKHLSVVILVEKPSAYANVAINGTVIRAALIDMLVSPAVDTVPI